MQDLYIWSFYIFLLFIVYINIKKTGIEDPLLRGLIWPISGIVFLVIGWDKGIRYDADYYTFLFLLCVPVLLSLRSTPKYLPKKSINTFTIKIFTLFAIFGLLTNLGDIFYNFDLSTSIYNPEITTFNLRGKLENPAIKFFAIGTNLSCMASLALANNFKLRNLKIFTVLWFLSSLVAGFSSPGKTLLVLPFFYFLDYKFWKRVLNPSSTNIQNFINFKQLTLSKRELLKIFLILLLFVAILIFTLSLVSSILELEDSFVFLTNRIFNASYPLSWILLRSSYINADFQYPPSEFANIFELWFKFIFKNLLDKEYINDTMPKYILSLIEGTGGDGLSSMNSNLMVEATMLHGRYFGSLITILTCSLGFFIRRVMLRASNINTYTLLFVPFIATGPFFCFQQGQYFWTQYIPIFVVISFLFFFLKAVAFLKDS